MESKQAANRLAGGVSPDCFSKTCATEMISNLEIICFFFYWNRAVAQSFLFVEIHQVGWVHYLKRGHAYKSHLYFLSRIRWAACTIQGQLSPVTISSSYTRAWRNPLICFCRVSPIRTSKSDTLSFWAAAIGSPIYLAKREAGFARPISGETTIDVCESRLCPLKKRMKRCLAVSGSVGTLKKPWTCGECRVIVMNVSIPAVCSRSAINEPYWDPWRIFFVRPSVRKIWDDGMHFCRSSSMGDVGSSWAALSDGRLLEGLVIAGCKHFFPGRWLLIGYIDYHYWTDQNGWDLKALPSKRQYLKLVLGCDWPLKNRLHCNLTRPFTPPCTICQIWFSNFHVNFVHQAIMLIFKDCIPLFFFWSPVFIVQAYFTILLVEKRFFNYS